MKRMLLIFLAGFFAYFSSLRYGFSQDDFIHLFSSQANNIGDFLNFFNPFYNYPDIFFYRPLTTQTYFFINRSIFGLNPLPFHFEGLFLHSINAVLFYLLIQKVWQNRKIAFVSGLFYAISAAHFLSLFYISAFQEIGRMFFILITFLFFLKYRENKQGKLYIYSIFTFIAALLSKETSLITPILFFPLEMIRKKEQSILSVVRSLLKPVTPFFIIILAYMVLRTAGFQAIFNQGSYKTTFSIWEIIQNLKWYLIWSFGLPEGLSTYPSLKPSSLFQFATDMPFGNIVIILVVLVIGIFVICVLQQKVFTRKILLLSILIFFLSIGPVLILAGHRYPQYLDLAFIGFLPILAYSFLQTSKIKKVLGMIGIILFVCLQIFSIRLSERTHWTTHRAKVADFYHNNIKKTYPILPQDSIITLVGTEESSYEVSIALINKYAFLVWYPNKIKQVNFMNKYPTDSKSAIIYPITEY